jgi:hypothetical protein
VESLASAIGVEAGTWSASAGDGDWVESDAIGAGPAAPAARTAEVKKARVMFKWFSLVESVR